MNKLFKEDILRIIAQGESETVEFKLKMPPERIIANVIVSFANTKGGVIIFGVNDTGEIIGVSEANSFIYKHKLEQVSDSLLPYPTLIDERFIEGKKLVYMIIDRVPEEFSPVLSSDGSLYSRKGDLTIKGQSRRAVVTVPEKIVKIFVAMSFRVEEEPSLVDYYQAIKRAVKKIDEKIVLIRIDLEEGDYEISSEIMKKIDEVDILIADFTLNPRNVYFEAGYGRGRSKRMIQIARKGTKLEFDVRNWRTIFYRNATELEHKIHNAIVKAIQDLEMKNSS